MSRDGAQNSRGNVLGLDLNYGLALRSVQFCPRFEFNLMMLCHNWQPNLSRCNLKVLKEKWTSR